MRARVLTALALIPPVLAAIFCTSPWPIFSLLIIISLVGLGEVRRLTGQAYTLFGFPLLLIAMGMPLSTQYSVSFAILSEVAFLAFVIGVLSILFVKRSSRNNPFALLHSGWLVGPLTSLFALHQSTSAPETWLFVTPVLLAIVPLWAGDTAAIFAGKAFGKHKLAPTISPKKTIEGAIANLMACVLAAWGLGQWIGIPLPQSIACGLVAGTFGQAGDLFESWIKRQANLKDSGTLLPGHGGILDRIDSILFTAPFVALILLLWK